jgi:rSAM/selenodomain-associated transferase 1
LCDIAERFSAERFSTGAFELVWAVDPPGAQMEPVVEKAARCVDQRGDGLGDRMWNCFSDLFAGGARRVVMIGSDAPHLADETIERAFADLERADVSLVPSRDGGYCLVGTARAHDLFSSIQMSTERVLEETLARIEALNLRAVVQPTEFDVDELADVDILAERIAAGAPGLSHTASVLARWQHNGKLAGRD